MSRLSPYWLWLVLALPALAMTNELLTSNSPRIYHILVHPTGEFSARFMIISMMATPLMLLFKGWRGPRWLRKNRRYFGVAAFAYAAAHTIFYLIDKASLDRILMELPRLYIWTGWLAFAIFIPLAVTSMDCFMRILGPNWKTLQRTTYVAAVLTLVHWAALHKWSGVVPAMVHFGPLIALEAYRIWYWYLRPSRRRSKETVEKPAIADTLTP
ncbi:ferric reductase-like transmembrane domain-containing protein [uncultured Shimia sp.]|uniref:sulfite oxidase heme-binding subunit YedZ n=1 Tax=uncultured Shimia sp. TaxID=573152 RepID=UPI0026139A9F|nr:ferric reductase-like transmembrane domain-containing protein [uncultured Shimia sp.]